MWKLFSFAFLLTLFGLSLGLAPNENKKNFLLFALYFNEDNVTGLTNCTKQPPGLVKGCIDNALFYENPKDARFFFIDQLPEIVKFIQNIAQNNTNSGGDDGPKYEIDFTQCGVYPACFVQPLGGELWSFTCDQPVVVFIAVIGIILSILIIISNVLIITVTLYNKSLRKPHSYFKLSLAFADLLAGIFVIPSIVHNSLNGFDYNKQVYTTLEMLDFTQVGSTDSSVAKFFGIMGILSTITALFSLLCLSVDSFLSVKSPLRYRIGDLVTKKKALIIVAVIWILSLLLSLLPVFTNSVFTYGLAHSTFQYVPFLKPVANTTTSDSPLTRFPHAFGYVIVIWGIPFVATWILTVMTSFQSRKMLKTMREARRRSIRSEKALDKVDRDLIKTVTVVLTLFTVTILPVFGIGIAVIFSPSPLCYNPATILAFFLATYIFICGRFLNVIVYNVFNKEFRTAFNRFFTQLFGFLCCVDPFDLEKLNSGSNGQKSSRLLAKSKNEKSSPSKSHSKETEVTSRGPSGSISISTDKGPSSPVPPSNGEAAPVLYMDSALTINEVDE